MYLLLHFSKRSTLYLLFFIFLFYSNHNKSELLVVSIIYSVYFFVEKSFKKFPLRKKSNLSHYSKSAKRMRESWSSEIAVNRVSRLTADQ